MTLEEYRVVILEKLRQCKDAKTARSLLADADLFLRNSRLTQLTQDKFWETLEDDLMIIADEAKQLQDPKASAALGAVVEAARARAHRFRARHGDHHEVRKVER